MKRLALVLLLTGCTHVSTEYVEVLPKPNHWAITQVTSPTASMKMAVYFDDGNRVAASASAAGTAPLGAAVSLLNAVGQGMVGFGTIQIAKSIGDFKIPYEFKHSGKIDISGVPDTIDVSGEVVHTGFPPAIPLVVVP